MGTSWLSCAKGLCCCCCSTRLGKAAAGASEAVRVIGRAASLGMLGHLLPEPRHARIKIRTSALQPHENPTSSWLHLEMYCPPASVTPRLRRSFSVPKLLVPSLRWSWEGVWHINLSIPAGRAGESRGLGHGGFYSVDFLTAATVWRFRGCCLVLLERWVVACCFLSSPRDTLPCLAGGCLERTSSWDSQSLREPPNPSQ